MEDHCYDCDDTRKGMHNHHEYETQVKALYISVDDDTKSMPVISFSGVQFLRYTVVNR